MNPPTLHVRTATVDDMDLLLRWREEAADWLQTEHGTDQWNRPADRQRMAGWIHEGSTFMAALQPDGEPVATVTSTPHGSPVLWTEEELGTPARYLHNLVVQRSHAGRGIGTCLGRWAASHAARTGVTIVRYTAWATNAKLLDYYDRIRGRYVRTVPGFHNGALFENPVVPRDDLPVVEAADVLV
ncbi:MAG: GNAT family N-acetyltransferase [Saccharopolyspora sp.]|uniref:GNAT family N-acetyltransferase n=1 Tax=Saccharopolyspora sp. TaxID=33915 RepID=UPI0025F3E6AA|nr:GNAT family N-acetyltransferase [Saccharopolyspora sp.]MBQ6643937.1 GNAT family N-acetyltransferase [Saccharopolyspora sp.]